MTKLQSQINQWLNYIEYTVKLAPKTIRSYSSDMSVFLEYCNSINIKQVSDLTLQHLHGFVEYQSSNSNATINHRTACLKQFFEYMVELNELNENLVEKIKLRRLKKRVPKSLTIDEAKQIIECARNKNTRDALIIETLLHTGLRSFELTNIKECDIKDGVLLVESGKGDKQREVPLSDYLLNRIEQYKLYKSRCGYITDNTYLFVSKRNDKLSEQSVQSIVKDLLREIGREDLSCHKTRSTFATMMLESGVDVVTIQQLLGHSTINTTLFYLNVTKEAKRKAISTNPLLG